MENSYNISSSFKTDGYSRIPKSRDEVPTRRILKAMQSTNRYSSSGTSLAFSLLIELGVSLEKWQIILIQMIKETAPSISNLKISQVMHGTVESQSEKTLLGCIIRTCKPASYVSMMSAKGNQNHIKKHVAFCNCLWNNPPPPKPDRTEGRCFSVVFLMLL